jgi:hypothetical protein
MQLCKPICFPDFAEASSAVIPTVMGLFDQPAIGAFPNFSFQRQK